MSESVFRVSVDTRPGTTSQLVLGSALHTVLAGIFILVASDITVVAAEGEEAEGKRVRAAAREKAEQLVDSALQARLHGQEERCLTLLEQALRVVPGYPRAMWLSGHVWEGGRWVTVDAHQQEAAESSQLDRYEDMRRQAMHNPQRELTLARWCDRMGLLPQRNLHYSRLLASGRLTESQTKEAVRALDLHLVGGQFWTREEIARRQARAAAEMASLQKWLPQLAESEKGLHSADPAEQAEAKRRLRSADSADILPALEAVLPVASEPLALEAVEALSRDRAFESTLALTRYALLSPYDPVRQAATGELGRRPWHEFVPFLLEALHSPVRSQYAIVRAPDGSIRYQHHFLHAGRDANSLVQANSASFPVARLNNLTVVEDAPVARSEVTRIDQDGANVAALGNVVQAAVRESQLMQYNSRVLLQNARVFPVLQGATGQQLPPEPLAWWQWWEQYNEDPKQRPTQVYTSYDQSTHSVNYDATRYQPTRQPVSSQPRRRRAQWNPLGRTGISRSCFAPGTQVWTERGLRPIESILPGDRVLSQHPDTGELSYQVVTSTTSGTANSGLAQVQVGDEPIYITQGHVVWVHGRGWEIVRRVRPGDRLASLQGGATVSDMAERPLPPLVYNLVVENFHTFFVGREGVLAHDFTYTTFRQPTQAVIPGLVR